MLPAPWREPKLKVLSLEENGFHPRSFECPVGLRVLKRSKRELRVQLLTPQPTDWLPAQESVSPTLC